MIKKIKLNENTLRSIIRRTLCEMQDPYSYGEYLSDHAPSQEDCYDTCLRASNSMRFNASYYPNQDLLVDENEEFGQWSDELENQPVIDIVIYPYFSYDYDGCDTDFYCEEVKWIFDGQKYPQYSKNIDAAIEREGVKDYFTDKIEMERNNL